MSVWVGGCTCIVFESSGTHVEVRGRPWVLVFPFCLLFIWDRVCCFMAAYTMLADPQASAHSMPTFHFFIGTLAFQAHTTTLSLMWALEAKLGSSGFCGNDLTHWTILRFPFNFLTVKNVFFPSLVCLYAFTQLFVSKHLLNTFYTQVFLEDIMNKLDRISYNFYCSVEKTKQ